MQDDDASLQSLALCVKALTEAKRHVPYRQSPLTRLLRDVFGGGGHQTTLVSIYLDILFSSRFSHETTQNEASIYTLSPAAWPR